MHTTGVRYFQQTLKNGEGLWPIMSRMWSLNRSGPERRGRGGGANMVREGERERGRSQHGERVGEGEGEEGE